MECQKEKDISKKNEGPTPSWNAKPLRSRGCMGLAKLKANRRFWPKEEQQRVNRRKIGAPSTV